MIISGKLLFGAASLLLSMSVAGAHAQTDQQNPYQHSNAAYKYSVKAPITPFTYDKVFTAIADKPFASADGSFFLDGFIGGDASNYFANVVGFSEQEIAQSRQNALDFFESRFGLTLDNPGLLFKDVEVDQAAGYRITSETGVPVPEEGFRMDEFGWVYVVVDPNGVTLGGEFAGRVVPAGTLFAYGDYVITRTSKAVQRAKEPVAERSLIRYQSVKPLVPDADGVVTLICELFSEEYGEGVAMGVVFPIMLSDGRSMVNTKTTLTFPKWGKLMPEGEGWVPPESR